MKKSLLLTLSLSVFGLVASAQSGAQPQVNPALQNQAAPYLKRQIIGNESDIQARMQNAKKSAVANSANGRTIGETTYDLQTNGSIQNRLIRHSANRISAVFTYSNTLDLAASDRGTGYVFRNSAGWSAQPTARIETERTGWPSLYVSSVGEGIIAHNTQSTVLTQNYRSTVGSGNWTQNLSITSPTLQITWNRVAVGGANNNTVHMIGVTAPTGNGGTVFQGMDGALLYFRSDDGGLTWSVNGIVLPGMDASVQPRYGGDNYAISARGNTVAFAVFNDFNPSFLMKSTDNGQTWTKTIFVNTGLAGYNVAAAGSISDVDGDAVADTIETTDNSGSILIDATGMVHIFYGRMRILDDDPAADAASSFFPATDGIMYWREDLDDDPFVIAQSPDKNNDGVIDIFGNSTAGIARYFLSMSSMPHAGLDAAGNIYLLYATHQEDLNNGIQNYRHVYIKKSMDGGCTWTEGIDMTPASNFAECVFATMDQNVTDSIRFIFQEDNIPGLAVRGEEHTFTNNFIVYKAVAPSQIPNTAEFCYTDLDAVGNTSFCQGDSLLLSAEACGTAFNWSTGESTPSIWINSYNQFTVDITTACGVVTESIQIDPPTGNIPSFNVVSTVAEACPGDTGTISVSGVSVGSQGGYVWSNGQTTPTISFTQGSSALSLSVTVTNCQGTGSQSITVDIPSSVDANVMGNTIFCPGDSVELMAEIQTGATYSWSVGGNVVSTDRSFFASNAGSYTLSVTNCAGTATETIDVVENNIVDVSIEVLGNLEICEGENLTLSATGGSNWAWVKDNVGIPGGNTQTIGIQSANQSGTYFFTAQNECGITGNSDTVNVVVNAAPEVPTLVLSGNQVTATAQGAASFLWFLNGNQSSQTGATYNIPANFTSPRITAIAVSAEGCQSALSSQVTGVNELYNAASLEVFPNPASTAITISINEAVKPGTFYEVYNVLGEVSLAGAITANQTQVDLAGLSGGVYFLKIADKSAANTIKLIVE